MSEPAIRWITQSAVEPFSACGSMIEERLRTGQTTVIKDGPFRTIHRVHLVSNDFHIKHCKVRGIRAWLRECFRPAKAKLEYFKLAEALRRNITTIEPVACGISNSKGSGDSFLVTRTVADAVSLTQHLEKHSGDPQSNKGPTARSRIQLSLSLGKFIAGVHEGGLLHPDLHPGNILIRGNNDSFEFFLIDLHNARLGPPLSRRASINNLIVFNRWFSLRTNRSDRLRFWRAYVIERMRLAGRMVVDYFDCRSLEDGTRKSNRRFWRRRFNRCVGGSRHFVPIRVGHTVGFVPRMETAEELKQLMADPDAPFRDAQTRILKNSPSSTVAEITLTIAGVRRRVIYKRFRRKSSWRSLRSLLRPSSCFRSWILGHAFLDCLLPTAKPLAVFETRKLGLASDGYLVTELIENSINLRQAIHQPSQKHRRIEMVARLVRELHDRGWSHRDLKAANILLAPDSAGHERAWFIDLVGARRPLRLTRRRCMRDLARLNASFLEPGCLSRSDRLRFLLSYLNACLHGPRAWKKWWIGIGNFVARKVEKNRKRRRPLA